MPAISDGIVARGLQVAQGGDVPPAPACPDDPNLVGAMDPAAGTRVNVGSVVTLFMNQATSPTSSPSP